MIAPIEYPTNVDWEQLPSHPRLFADSERIATVKSFSDGIGMALRDLLRDEANKALASEPLVYPPTGFILFPVREVQGRILALALMYRLTREKPYFERAREELLQLAALPEWRPSHFLDAGEAALAAGVGLDWLYSDLAPEERDRIAEAIVNNALLPSLDVPEGGDSWVNGDFNWNQVCHCGLAVGALAVAEREPKLAQHIVQRAIRNVPSAGAVYAPDGSYPEGPSYWSYGTTFHVILVEALRSVLGTAYGLERSPGFLETADFRAQMIGPTGLDYNFSDYHPSPILDPVLLWFARERASREPARTEISNIIAVHRDRITNTFPAPDSTSALNRHLPLGLLWWKPTLPPLSESPTLPLHWTAAGKLPLAVLRSGWNDPNATYLAIKGGTPNHSHAHMDVGSFVLDAEGVRWAIDLGTEEYNRMRAAKLDLWNYSQNSSRWTTFRVGPEGHNLLRFNEALQDITGKAEIRRIPDMGGVYGDVVDLTSLYHKEVKRVERTVRMYPDRCAAITDEWETGDRPVSVHWQWLTTASVVQTKKGLRLDQAGSALHLSLVCSSAFTIAIEDVSEPKATQDSPNPGLRRIVVRLATEAKSRGMLEMTAAPGGRRDGKFIGIALDGTEDTVLQ